MTWLGPCMTHCGSEVNVGVRVRVGRGVSEGVAVGVSVGKMIGVTVAGSVGEGNRVAVEEGAIVGVEGITSWNAPHPISKRAKPAIQKMVRLVITSLLRFDWTPQHLSWRPVPGRTFVAALSAEQPAMTEKLYNG